MQLPKVELKQANIPMWIFQNTFASTETQRHVKPLRMIDEVCFEMADIKQTRFKYGRKTRKKAYLIKIKNLIKQAVLESAAKNTNLTPSELAESVCSAVMFIDSYGR
ncbi:hypothetical protein CGSHiGG_00945 [Haemophilus influenzae PittGG]|uniref:Uncharacterized protein n=1 Tax=Haemophilus influenzae (strain PittGG) TaxID=374931 RepID=A5UES9_HAEIG|nr:hypothetical protein CGSHiGG_00945 [Haemophilus influenzae PittGG]